MVVSSVWGALTSHTMLVMSAAPSATILINATRLDPESLESPSTRRSMPLYLLTRAPRNACTRDISQATKSAPPNPSAHNGKWSCMTTSTRSERMVVTVLE